MAKVLYNCPALKIQIVDSGGGIAYQQEGTPAALRASPIPNNISLITEPAPSDLSAYGVNMTAMQKVKQKEHNIFFDKGDIIRLKISSQEYHSEITPPKFLPEYVDVLLEGVLLW